MPRQELIEQTIQHLVGDIPDEGGHYITMWAPRQRGKTWIMQHALHQLQTDPRYAGFDTIKMNLEHLKMEHDPNVIGRVIDLIIRHANQRYGLEVKTYSSDPEYRAALQQAARYGQSL